MSDYKRLRKTESDQKVDGENPEELDALQAEFASHVHGGNQKKSDGNQSDDAFLWLIPYMDNERYGNGHILFKTGDRADKGYYVKKGTIRLKEMDIVVSPGELIGETGILSPYHARTDTAICETDIELSTLTQDKMITLLYKKPSLLFDLMRLSLQRFTINLARTVEEKQKIEDELKVARAIQASMLPRNFPDRYEFDIFASMEPAKEIGGDFYDFFFTNPDTICLVIGDVSGKGVPAALFMVVSKTLLRIEAMHNAEPHEILRRVNEMLIPDNEECMFVTVFCALFNFKTGELRYSNAGHNPPLFCRDDQSIEFMELKKSVVLGAIPGLDFITETRKMEKGASIFLYTDGVTEAMNKELQQYSNQRLYNMLDRSSKQDVKKILTLIKNDVDAFVDNAAQSDDITMMAMKYNA